MLAVAAEVGASPRSGIDPVADDARTKLACTNAGKVVSPAWSARIAATNRGSSNAGIRIVSPVMSVPGCKTSPACVR